MTSPRRWTRPAIAARAGVGRAFAANLRSALAQIDGNAAGTAQNRDAEYLHQLRVGLRRLRATLHAFHPLLRRRKAARVGRALRRILRGLGAARDWDVFRASHPGGRLLRAARRPGTVARRQAEQSLQSPALRRTLRQLRAWAETPPWRSAADPGQSAAAFAPRALRRLHDRLSAEARGIDWSDAVQRHRVRVKAKWLRYGCECFTAAYSERQTRLYRDRLRKLQQILGEMNDAVVQRALLQDLAREAGLKQAAAALRSALAARERSLLGEASRRWNELEATRPFWRRAAA
jgi:CHAD domain-containing protein